MDQRGPLDVISAQKSPPDKTSLQPSNADPNGVKVAVAPQGYGGGIPPKIEKGIEPPETKAQS